MICRCVAGVALLLCGWSTAQAPELPEGRLLFLIGLGDLNRGANTSTLVVDVGSWAVPRSYDFDQRDAERQRRQAISAAMEGDPNGYRDGTPYQLRDAAGQPLPIYWFPWRARVVVERVSRTGVVITEDDVEAARSAAREGRDYEPKHIVGGWVYADPEFWSGEADGFTEKDCESARNSRGASGERVVVYTVEPASRDSLEDYTGKYVGYPLCMVLDDEIIIAPLLADALYDSVMISCGGMGFMQEEQEYLLDALRGGGVAIDPEPPQEERGPDIGMFLSFAAITVGILGLILLLIRRLSSK